MSGLIFRISSDAQLDVMSMRTSEQTRHRFPERTWIINTLRVSVTAMALTNSQEIQRRIFVDMIRALPELTLSGFSRLLTERFSDIASTVTVGDLIGAASSKRSTSAPAAASAEAPVKRGPGRPKGSKTKNRKAATAAPAEAPRGPGRPPGKAAGKPPAVDTRTRAGRDRYEAAIRAFIIGAGRPVSAPEVRASAGGDDVQARRALNRLIDRGEVGYQGKARGTRYVAP